MSHPVATLPAARVRPDAPGALLAVLALALLLLSVPYQIGRAHV